jgi:OPA family glycerol-3-phosphate transporter-like MFS transporter
VRQRPAVVLLTLVVGYAAFYLCRANVESAFPLLKQTFGFSKTQLGLLSSVPIAAYAVGKVVMGALGDVIGGKRLIVLATAGSVAATFAFGASGALGAFIVCASANRFSQSGGWSGAVHVIACRFEAKRHGLVMGIMSTSYELGNVLALLLCSAITRFLRGWRPLFVVNPLLLGAAGLLVVLALPAGGPPPAAHEPPAAFDHDEPPLRVIMLSLARRPAFWIAVALSVLLTFLRIGFLTWTPMYLYEVSHKADISGAIAKAAIFSSAGVVAALSTGALSDRLGPGRRAPLMAGSLAVVVVLVLVLAHSNVRSPVTAALLIGGIGLFLLGPYSLLAGAVALDVSGRRGAATAAGIIDGAGYLGASSAGVLLGKLAEEHGWSAAFDATAAVALIATILAGVWAVATLRRRA